jgi:hypothetical protein
MDNEMRDIKDNIGKIEKDVNKNTDVINNIRDGVNDKDNDISQL